MGHTSPSWHWTDIDGEGKGRAPHRYTLLAAATADGKRAHVHNRKGLGTFECLEFLLSLPRGAKCFSYSFNYDITKILEDCPDHVIYCLMRPELRQYENPEDRKKGPIPIKWRGYSLNLLQTRFTVRRGNRKVVIWDIWKFFQSRFVDALTKWDIEADLETIKRMKDARSEFEKLDDESVLGYCYSECEALGRLARKLTDAHTAAGLHLRDYYGAGSSASAMLKILGIERKDPPPELFDAVQRAFFGGRFEQSIIGPIERPVYGYDISSAYPYQLSLLPCLDCGVWERVNRRQDLEGATTALVRYSLESASTDLPWSPFPYRSKDGSICYPANSRGYVWLAEYLAGERLLPANTKFEFAWRYRTDCRCAPFARVPEWYRYRLTGLSKDGSGIVIKLGMNSIYGKLAQSVGNPKFQNWIWAGMVTSGTRAQLLGMLGNHHDWSNMLACATDGLYTTEKLSPSVPHDTGTYDLNKPLGGWELKTQERGMFFARPGIYWPLQATEAEVEEFRARGLGRTVLLRNHEAITAAYERGEESVRVTQLQRFCGARSSITRTQKPPYRYTRSPDYGQWVDRPIDLTFDPMPKRAYIRPDKSLALRLIDGRELSAPYDKATISDEATEMLVNALEQSEQPDLELVEF